MDEISIKKTSNPEYGYETKEQLLKETKQHRYDVHKVLRFISEELSNRGYYHDWTKIEYFDQFAQDTLERKDTPDFKSREWYKIHTVEERHHINANVPIDVDLFDVLEMIVDCIVAGKSRSGRVNYDFLRLKDDILEKSYWNTVNKLEKKIVVE